AEGGGGVPGLAVRDEREVLVGLLPGLEGDADDAPVVVEPGPAPFVERDLGREALGAVGEEPSDAAAAGLLVAGPGEDHVPMERDAGLLEGDEDLERGGRHPEGVRDAAPDETPVALGHAK